MLDLNRFAPYTNPKDVEEPNESSDYLQNLHNNVTAHPTTLMNRDFTVPEADYENCPNCSRKFFVGRLKLHLKSCKEGKPQKSIKPRASRERPSEGLTNENNERHSRRSKENEAPEDLTEISNRAENTKKNLNAKKWKPVERDTQTEQPSQRYSSQALHAANRDFDNVQDNYEDSQRASHDQERPKEEDGRVGCSICGRFFHEDRVMKHENACKKSNKKRAVFDTTKQRAIPEQGLVKIDNSEKNKKTLKRKISMEDQQGGEKEKEGQSKKVPSWKSQHESLIENIKFNRKLKQMEARGEDTRHLVAPAAVNDDYVTCSHCFRKFNPAVAERHIPKCKNIFNRPKPPKNIKLDKMEEIEKVDRTKVNFILKKGSVSVKRSSEPEFKEPTSPTANFSENPANKDSKKATHRSPKPKFSTANYEQAEDEILVRENVSPQALYKRQNPENSAKKTVLPEIKRGGNDHSDYEGNTPGKKGPGLRDQSPHVPIREIKKVFSERMPKKDNLLQNYQGLGDRTSAYACQSCPYCMRKFAQHAAERHIPVCKDLQKRLFVKKPDETMYDDKKKTKMSSTVFGMKGGFANKLMENGEAAPPRSSHLGSHSTTYEPFFGEKRPKKSERRPLPLQSSQIEAKETNQIEKPILLVKQKSAPPSQYFCTCCGTKYASTHKFCGNCGNKK